MDDPVLQTSSLPADSREEHLRLILEMSAIGVWGLDVVSGAAWRNAQHDLIFGYDRLLPDWTYATFLDHVIPLDRPMVETRYGGALAAGTPWSFECRIRRADGETRWIDATGRPIESETGEVVRLIGHVIDVTHTKDNEERLRLLNDELNHRVRNTLAVVQAIAARSFQGHVAVEQARADFTGRIDALAAAHALLSESAWTKAELEQVVEKTLLPHRKPDTPGGGGGFEVSPGPGVPLSPKHAVSLTMALNELATNATKHGALAHAEGRVELSWKVVEPDDVDDGGRKVEISWRESGGPVVERGTRNGFGVTLLQRILPADMDGEVEMLFEPTGLRCRIVFDAALPDGRVH